MEGPELGRPTSHHPITVTMTRPLQREYILLLISWVPASLLFILTLDKLYTYHVPDTGNTGVCEYSCILGFEFEGGEIPPFHINMVESPKFKGDEGNKIGAQIRLY